MRECHSFNHILVSNEMNEREGRKRLILRIHKRNDCFGRGREGEGVCCLEKENEELGSDLNSGEDMDCC